MSKSNKMMNVGRKDYRDITTRELPKFIELSINSNLPVFLWGFSGIGKSAIIESACRKMDYECKALLAMIRNLVDFNGLPDVVENEYGNKKTTFIPPGEIPLAGEHLPEPLIIFLDELPATPTQVQGALFRIICERMLDDKPIHENVRFIAAGNPQSMTGALSNKVPTPLLNKFLHLNLKIVASEWIGDYAIPAKLHPAIISFIDSKPDWLINNTIRDDNIKAHIANKSFPTPRTIDYASRALFEAERLGLEEAYIYTFIAAAVGPDFTTEFMNFYKDVYKVPSARDIISGKAKKSDVDVAQQFYLVNSLLQYLSDAFTKANNNSGDETYSKELGILFNFIKESCSQSMLMAFLTILFKVYKLGIDFRKNRDIADMMQKDKDFRYLIEYAQS